MALVELSLCGWTQNRAEFVAIPWPVAKLSFQKMHLPPPEGRRSAISKGISGTVAIEFGSCAHGTDVRGKTQILAPTSRSISQGVETPAPRPQHQIRQRIDLIQQLAALSEPKPAFDTLNRRPRQWNAVTNNSIGFTRRLPMDTG